MCVSYYYHVFVIFSVYIGEEQGEEPDFQYIPDTQQICNNLPQGSDPLGGSLMLLQDSLDSGAALAQFEVRLLVICLLPTGFCVFDNS